jgi:5-methylcytosine-specific restriction endonuclease McrA
MARRLPGSIRREVLRKYDHKCHFCDVETDVQVHHIDGHAANHDIDNLIAVCHDCHMNIHYPPEDDEKWQKWNDKILPRSERKTGDEIP